MKRLIVVGAGGFGREVLDVIDALNATNGDKIWSPIVVDDAPSDANLDRLARRGATFGGGLQGILDGAPYAAYVVAVGDPAVRRRIVRRFDDAGFDAAILRHPESTIGADVTLSVGTVVCAGVRVTTNVLVGRHVHLNLNVTVGHDSVIGDFVSVNPGVAISGDCYVDDGAILGTGAAVINGLRIGRDAVVGAASCVTKDVPSSTVVKGVPAR